MSTSLPTQPSPVSAPCIKAKGNPKAKMMLIGEAPGEEEQRMGIPFVGTSGKELDRLLEEAQLDPTELYFTNVLWTRPPNNNLDLFLVTKKSLEATYPSAIRPVKQGGFLHPNFLPELERLYSEISSVNPNIIVALGNTALWALTGSAAISKMRGTLIASPYGKVLPTYHPAAVLREWSLRVLVLADLIKAKRHSTTPDLVRPAREIWINPTIQDIIRWMRQEIPNAKALAVDVETRNGQITEIGFASRRDCALVIPFIRGYNDNYWNFEDECHAWRAVRSILSSSVPKIFQNGLYDLQYIWRAGVRVNMAQEDTMLLHHSLYPELNKGLGFLGSIYTDEPAWKILRSRKDTVEKRDDE